MFQRFFATPELNLLLAAVVCVLCVLHQVWNEERVGTRRQLIIGTTGLIGVLAGVALAELRSIIAGGTLWGVVIVSGIIWIHDDFVSS